jgi:hypothetical protein
MPALVRGYHRSLNPEPHPHAFMYRVVESLLGTIQGSRPWSSGVPSSTEETQGAVFLPAIA